MADWIGIQRNVRLMSVTDLEKHNISSFVEFTDLEINASYIILDICVFFPKKTTNIF